MPGLRLLAAAQAVVRARSRALVERRRSAAGTGAARLSARRPRSGRAGTRPGLAGRCDGSATIRHGSAEGVAGRLAQWVSRVRRRSDCAGAAGPRPAKPARASLRPGLRVLSERAATMDPARFQCSGSEFVGWRAAREHVRWASAVLALSRAGAERGRFAGAAAGRAACTFPNSAPIRRGFGLPASSVREATSRCSRWCRETRRPRSCIVGNFGS